MADDWGSASDVKQSHRRFYDRITAELDASDVGPYSFFLNLGYVADGSPEFAPRPPPPHVLNRTSVKLVLELIGDCDLAGRRLLDVGCGRGGTVRVVSTLFEPCVVVGVDLSGAAVRFDRHAHRAPNIKFCQADAEQLPFADSSFDVVTSVESSHTYPAIDAFYTEVRRVLAVGGHFLYTDVLPVEKMARSVARLEQLGFDVIHNRDITRNVLLSCDQVAGRRATAFQGHDDVHALGNFLATPDSQVYESMRSGACVFRLLQLRRQRQ
jgi:SAM-dependent methyltransferase